MGNETQVEMGTGREAERKDIGRHGLKIAQMFKAVKGAFRLCKQISVIHGVFKEVAGFAANELSG